MKTSERVEREFKEWQERYDIPYSEHFRVKTLLALQEEYDNIVPADNNTRTRESILKMINEIHSKFPYKMFEEKKKSILYYTIDIIKDNKLKLTAFTDNKLYSMVSINPKDMAKKLVLLGNNKYIYTDSFGLTQAVTDILLTLGVTVKNLELISNTL
jgi:hypothetical protein